MPVGVPILAECDKTGAQLMRNMLGFPSSAAYEHNINLSTRPGVPQAVNGILSLDFCVSVIAHKLQNSQARLLATDTTLSAAFEVAY
jgi:hypothetical protein